MDGPALLIVDAANVVGSVPDGWWRDRAGATQRLRDRLRAVAENGLPGGPSEFVSPPEVLLVVEGAARGTASIQGVRVVAARGSGDDEIVDLVSAEPADRVVAVVTSDRALRERVKALGAQVLGARNLRDLD